MSKVNLRVDWATYQAARYACENWHYSKCTPKSKQVWIGAWEDEKFIGIVSIGRSSTPYLGDRYNLKTTQVAELTRIALSSHKTPVSKILSIAIRMIKKQSPELQLLVSLADKKVGHHGGIYQATNWIYVGQSSSMTQFFFRGKWRNDTQLQRFLQRNPEMKLKLKKRKIQGKHKYLMPLNDRMWSLLKPLSKPYPKRVRSADSGTTGNQPEGGGANPTRTLS